MRTPPPKTIPTHQKRPSACWWTALGAAGESPDGLLLDLYCGVGTLSLLGSRKFKFVTGVGVVRSSIRDAQANAAGNGIINADFTAADIGDFFTPVRKEWLKSLKDIVVMLDPPRTGCQPEVIAHLLDVRPRRIVYVSCHPATLARDIKLLAPSYAVKGVTPVDLFPQTSHIETVTLLDRRPA